MNTAAVDPAAVPGLTPVLTPGSVPGSPPGPAAPGARTVPGKEPEPAPDGAGASASGPADADASDSGPSGSSGSGSSVRSDEEAPGGRTGGDEVPAEAAARASDGPVFEAADRRGAVIADGSGVRLRLDDQEAEFGWDEIAAVEYGTSRFGRRLTVTVHTPNQRWYPGDVEAPTKAVLEEWTSGLDSVLDAYFND